MSMGARAEEGVYVELAELVALRHSARRTTLLPRQPVNSLLAGRRASKLRGRGLDFEELRAYVAGDDVRSIDWRVTARTGRPYVRSYREERDRPGVPALAVVVARRGVAVAGLEVVVAHRRAQRPPMPGDERVGGVEADVDPRRRALSRRREAHPRLTRRPFADQSQPERQVGLAREPAHVGVPGVLVAVQRAVAAVDETGRLQQPAAAGGIPADSPREAGATVEVRADALPQDGRLQTPGVTDADYGLVVTGGTLASPCPVDLNADGVVDFADYLEFLTLFDGQDDRADFTADGVHDVRIRLRGPLRLAHVGFSG